MDTITYSLAAHADKLARETATLHTNVYTNDDVTKLAAIEDNATADQTKADIDTLGIDAATVDNFTVAKSVPADAVFTEFDDSSLITAVALKQPIVGSSYSQNTDGTISATGTYTFNFASGDMEQVTLSGTAITMTMAFTGFITGKVCSMILDIVNAGDHTVAYPAGTLFAGGTSPVFTPSGTDRLMVIKDKDDLYTITVVGLDIKVVA